MIYGDKAYENESLRREFEESGGEWRVLHKKPRGRKKQHVADTRFNKKNSRTRAFVEHGFNIMKNIWGHARTRYRGIDKNAVQFIALAMLSNIYRLRRKLA